MLAALILSIVTGDSRIFSGTLEAATTTSEPKTKAGVRLTLKEPVFPLTTTSFELKPTEEKTKV